MKLTNQGSPRSGNCLSNEDGNIITLHFNHSVCKHGMWKKNKVIFSGKTNWQNNLQAAAGLATNIQSPKTM
jgi:hypothetical protein